MPGGWRRNDRDMSPSEGHVRIAFHRHQVITGSYQQSRLAIVPSPCPMVFLSATALAIAIAIAIALAIAATVIFWL
jgi:hypothetical protein